MKNLIYGYLLVILISLASCSSYNRLLKSTDYELKFRMAKEYYANEEYDRALPLLEELWTIYKGSDKGEEVYYYFARAYFGAEDFILSSYHLKYFVRTYPNSQYAEECLYLAAMSYYIDSPKYSLDQSNTKLAIQEFQLFINEYPTSSRIPECNTNIDKLKLKLEKKSFEIAKLYFNTENYKSAFIAFENTLKDFPNTVYREESVYLKGKSIYLLAMNSVESKKRERLQKSLETCQSYIDSYPGGKFTKDTQIYLEKTSKELNKVESGVSN